MIRYKNKIVVSSVEDHKQVVSKVPFYRRKDLTIRSVNGLTLRMTDCKSTYDHMMECLDKTIILIQSLSHQEMFEVLINLDKKGIENMYQHLFRKWHHSDVGIWDYRSIERTLKYRLDVLNNREPIKHRYMFARP